MLRTNIPANSAGDDSRRILLRIQMISTEFADGEGSWRFWWKIQIVPMKVPNDFDRDSRRFRKSLLACPKEEVSDGFSGHSTVSDDLELDGGDSKRFK